MTNGKTVSGKKQTCFLILILLLVFLLISAGKVSAETTASKTGFITKNGNTYYVDANGSYHKGWLTQSGKRYYFNTTSGIMLKGWWYVKSKKTYRYFSKADGHMLTGWVTSSKGSTRYFDSDGYMAIGFYDFSGGTCYFNAKGVQQKGCFVKVNSHTYYLYSKTGYVAKKVFLTSGNGNTRYFTASGIMCEGWVKNSKGGMRYFKPGTGVMYKGLKTVDGKKYYFNKTTGIARSGWVTISSAKYYFSPSDFAMVTDSWINDKYYVGSNGKLVAGMVKFMWPLPVENNTISSYFGNRVSPGGIGSTNHKGIDISASTGTPIYAAAAGTVTVKQVPSESGGAGNYTVIDHGNGISTEYMHQSAFASGIVVGSKVKKGQIIGYVGSTGNSTGPHLHLGVIVDGTRVDPLKKDSNGNSLYFTVP